MERDVESGNAVRAETDRRLKDLIRQSEQLKNFRMNMRPQASSPLLLSLEDGTRFYGSPCCPQAPKRS